MFAGCNILSITDSELYMLVDIYQIIYPSESIHIVDFNTIPLHVSITSIYSFFWIYICILQL